MGGRGASSGLDTIKQVTVNIDGNNITYRNEKGKTWVVGTGGVTGDTVPRTLKEIETSARKAGYPVKTYTNKELAQYEKEYRKERKKASKQLDELWFKAGPRPRKGMKGH